MPSMYAAVVLAASMLLAGCGGGNNLLLGRVEARVGTHNVVVTDCYKTSVPPPKTIEAAAETIYEFAPCRDAVVVIRGAELSVNGQSYGHLKASDGVVVDHGVVSIEH